MRLTIKVIILAIMYIVLSVGVSFTVSSIAEDNESNLQDNSNSEISELEELNTATSLSMDKEIAFPRDI